MGSKQTAIKTISLLHSLQLYRCQLIDAVSLLVLPVDSLHYSYLISFCCQLVVEADGFACVCLMHYFYPYQIPFLVGFLLIYIERGAQDILLYTHVWSSNKATLEPPGSCIAPSTYSR